MDSKKEEAGPEAGRSTASLGFFNLARGLGTLFVLLGHSITVYYPKTEAVYDATFSGWGTVLGGSVMALFFFISGYGFYQRSPRKCVSIQTKLLLKPYCLSALAVLLTKLLLAVVEGRSFLAHGGEYVLTYLLGLNAEGGGQLGIFPVESVGIFWFVLALMNGWILYNSILRLKRKGLQWALVAGCVLLGYGLTLISSVWPFCLHMSLMAVGYLAVGRQMRESDLLERQLPLWVYGLLALPVLISFAWGQVDMLTGTWKLGLLDVLSTFCLGFLLMRLYTRFNRKERRGRLVGLLEAGGFRSMWVLCIHGYEKVIFPWYRLAQWLPDRPLLGSCLCLVARCLVIFVLYWILTWVNRLWNGRKWARKGKITLE